MMHRISSRLDAGMAVADALGEPAAIAAELVLPAEPASLLLVCVPGGGMNRHYFDLATPPGEAEASFASAMVARGFAVAMLDPLGIGDSSRPADAYLLTPALQGAALATATDALLRQLREGALVGTPALPDLRSVGVGHSFGAALTLAAEDAGARHAGLVLLGFGIAGAGARAPLAGATLPPDELRARLAELTRVRYPQAYIDLPQAEGARAAILHAAADRLLATAALASITPGLFAGEAQRVTVPVLLGFGDKDIHDASDAAVSDYPGSRDVTLLVLPDTRHNHFLYPSRTGLFDRIAHWANAL